MKRMLLRFHREEDGQVMLLALITAVFLVLIMAFPVNVGWTIAKRLKLQNAADAAAYSAAVVEADGLSAIAWLNNAESWCYQREYGLELKFCTYGVYALLERWGDEKGTNKPGNQDYDLDAKDWYSDFKNKINGKTPEEAFNDFMDHESGLINKGRNNYSKDNRTLEMWTLTLRLVAEQIAKQLPRMMRYEAMRIAYINTYDGAVGARRDQDQVYMAFFPDENSDTVQLNFTPNPNKDQYAGDVCSDNSFMQYEMWHGKDDGGCRFVERAMQIAADEKAFFMNSSNGKLNTSGIGDHNIIDDQGKLNMGSIDNKDKPWYNEYDCEPRRISDLYLAFAKTVICWHQKDKDGSGGHDKPDKTPCGHWHPNHWHMHYNCTHITFTVPFDGTYHFHIPIPTSHEDGYEKNRWCLDDYKCGQWDSPIPGCGCVGVGDIQGMIAEGVGGAQSVVNQASQVVNWAQTAYDNNPTQANWDALQTAKQALQTAQDDLQMLLNTAATAAGALGLNPIMETHIHLSVIPASDIDVLVVDTPSPGKGSDIEAWWHHAIHYCPLCFTLDGAHNGEFPQSEARDFHGLGYNKLSIYMPNQPQRADHHFAVPDSSVEAVNGKKKSTVRAYISDLLSSAYSTWFNFKKEACFHQIHKYNYSPSQPAPPPGTVEPMLCPTVIMKPVTSAADKHNFFNWGITVALWQKQHSIMFRKYTQAQGRGGVFLEMEGMLAIASAKVGIRVDHSLYTDRSGREGATKYFPERVITGIGEKSRSGEPAGPYNPAYMRNNFLSNRDRGKPILNLFHTDWAARLVPIQRAVPESEYPQAAKYVLTQTHRIYFWQNNNSEPGVRNEPISGSAWTDIDGQGFSNEDWKFLTEYLVH